MREENPNDIKKCHDIITSEEYLDIYYKLLKDIEEATEEAGAECTERIVQDYVMFHIKMDPEDCDEFYLDSEYFLLPNMYGLSSTSSIEAAGIGATLKNKDLDLTGNGVIVAIIDTGIDYTHEAFRYEDNTSKIISIWDQTIAGNPPQGFLYGSEYSNEQINDALNSDNPLSQVPTVDEIGHGTFIAGLAVGRPNRKEKFQGAAPGADLIIVKLKQAKKCVKEFLQIREDAIAFQSNHIFQGLNYVIKKIQELNKPVVILLTVGSSDGAHNGADVLEETLAEHGDLYGVVTVLAAGNEANKAHHYRGIVKEKEQIDVQLNIAEKEKGVFLNMWCPLPDRISIELISPSGSTTGKVPFIRREWQEYKFQIESTVIRIHYDLTKERTEEESITVVLRNPLAGLWTIVVYGDFIINGEFDIYLPVTGFIDDNTIFLGSDPDTTVVIPATNTGTITVGVYNEIINSIYIPSGRGYTRADRVKPDFVAPGVNVIGPYPNNSYGVMSGTSVGAAITAGASALLLEWGIIKENDPYINTIGVKNYLARGARRRKGLKYPNREWGYGEIDLLNTFKVIQS